MMSTLLKLDVDIADDSVIALATRCPHLRSLGLYYCKNITDRAMYSLAHSKVNNRMWGSVKGGNDIGILEKFLLICQVAHF